MLTLKEVFFLFFLFYSLFLINITTAQEIKTESKVNISPINRIPQIFPIGDNTAYIGEAFIYQVEAIDYDNDTLFYYDDTPLFKINETSGLIYYVPSIFDLGTHNITITVTDNKDNSSASFLLRVEERYVSPGMGIPPVINFTNVTANFSIHLYRGWNFISIPVILQNRDIGHVLRNLGGKYEYLLEWDNIIQEFKIYSVKGTREFDEFDSDKSYFIYMNQEADLLIEGNLYGSVDIWLNKGWNSPIYPYNFTQIITNGKYYNINFEYKLGWNTLRQEFDVHSAKSSGAESSIKIGEGLMLYIPQTDILFYRRI